MALVGKLPGPIAVVNIGGVANVTWIGYDPDPGRRLLAFDTGPGNALIDDWMQAHGKDAVRRRRRLRSLAGASTRSALTALLAHPYFAAPPPKSLDRNAFSLDAISSLSLEDGAATLTAFTAAAIARSRLLVPGAAPRPGSSPAADAATRR